MKDLNEVTLLGNVGTDPVLKTFDNGGVILRLNVATNRNYKDSSGEWHTTTEWHTVTVKIPQQAERLMDQLRKGSRVLVKGGLETRSYTAKDGTQKYTTEVVVAGAGSFVADQTGRRQALADTPEKERPPASKPSPRSEPDFDDDIPF